MCVILSKLIYIEKVGFFYILKVLFFQFPVTLSKCLLACASDYVGHLNIKESWIVCGTLFCDAVNK